jgi:hypothetical protein
VALANKMARTAWALLAKGAPIGRLRLRQRRGVWRWEDEVASVRSRTAGVMTALIETVTENPCWVTRDLSACFCLGPDPRITSGLADWPACLGAPQPRRPSDAVTMRLP